MAPKTISTITLKQYLLATSEKGLLQLSPPAVYHRLRNDLLSRRGLAMYAHPPSAIEAMVFKQSYLTVSNAGLLTLKGPTIPHHAGRSIWRVPSEIWTIIFSHTQKPCEPNDTKTATRNKKTFYNIAATCTRFRHELAPEMCKELHMLSRDCARRAEKPPMIDQLSNFAHSSMKNLKYLPRYCKTLDLTMGGNLDQSSPVTIQRLLEILPKLSYVETLTYYWSFSEQPEICHEHVIWERRCPRCVRRHVYMTYSEQRTSLACMFHTLNLTNIKTLSIAAAFVSDWKTSQALSWMPHLTNLSLVVDRSTKDSDPSLGEIIRTLNLPQLEVLQLFRRSTKEVRRFDFDDNHNWHWPLHEGNTVPEHMKGRANFTSLTIENQRYHISDLIDLMSWPRALEHISVSCTKFKPLVGMPTHLARQVEVESLLRTHKGSLRRIEVHILIDRYLDSLSLRGQSINFRDFSHLEVLTMSIWNLPNNPRVAAQFLLAPNLHTLILDYDDRFTTRDTPSPKGSSFIADLRAYRRKGGIDYPRRLVGFMRSYGSRIRAFRIKMTPTKPSQRDVERAENLPAYPWENFEQCREEFARRAISAEWNEPNVSRAEYDQLVEDRCWYAISKEVLEMAGRLKARSIKPARAKNSDCPELVGSS